MKNFVIVVILCLFASTLEAQKIVEKHIDFSEKESLILNLQITDTISINTWNKNEVFVRASININDNKDNDAYLTSFDDSGEIARVTAEFKSGYYKGKQDCFTHGEIIWEIFIPENAKFSVATINGNIIINGKTSEINAKSISGFIDLTLSPNSKADLEMKTITGTIYSNHEIPTKRHSYRSEIYDTVNGGGNAISLETISGDIFLRE